MKNLIFVLFLSSVFLTFKTQAQIASRILVTQSSPRDTFPDNYTFIDNSPGAMNRWWVAKWDSVKIKPINIRWINDSIIAIGDLRYAKLSGSYTDPSFIQSLSSSKVFGLSPVALSGNYSDLSGLPNLANYYPISNPNGYISGITGAMVTGALGYIPYDASNPNNYITNSALNPYLLKVDTTNKWLGIGYVPAWSSIAGTPTTLSGYGITDGVTSSSLTSTLANYVTNSSLSSTLGSYATTSALTSGLSGKENTITAGTTSQYWRGDKTWQTFPAQYNPTAGTGISITGTYPNQTITNSSPDQTVSLTAGSGISISGTYPSFTITNTNSGRTINNNVSRVFNSNYTISVTQYATVRYTVTLSCATPLLAGSASAQVFLEYSTNSGSSWITVSDVLNTQTVALSVSIQIATPQNFVLSGDIPPNALVRLRSVTSGSGAVTYVRGQETLF